MQLDPDEVKDISVEEYKALIDQGTEVVLIDVREPFERAMYHINGDLIPLNTLPNRVDDLAEQKDKHIIIYCRSGMRSDTAKRYLISQGFSNVQNLLGGVLAWQKAGY